MPYHGGKRDRHTYHQLRRRGAIPNGAGVFTHLDTIPVRASHRARAHTRRIVQLPGAAPLSVARARQVILARRLALQEAASKMLHNPTEEHVAAHRRATHLYNEARTSFRRDTGEEAW
jgi:hypothetical protein